MNMFKVTGAVKRFPGKYGWYYVELDEDLSKDFRTIIKNKWPALLGAKFTIHKTVWDSSIMPIKNGPLFVALPAKIRKAENIDIDQIITIQFELKI